MLCFFIISSERNQLTLPFDLAQIIFFAFELQLRKSLIGLPQYEIGFSKYVVLFSPLYSLIVYDYYDYIIILGEKQHMGSVSPCDIRVLNCHILQK